MSKLRKPNVFDLHPIKFTTQVGLQKWEMSGWQFRDLVRLYHIFRERNSKKKAEDLFVFLNKVSEVMGYNNFNIEENVSLQDMGIEKNV